MAFWLAVSWVRWAKVPLVLVKVPRWMRWSSARSLAQVWPIAVSATRMGMFHAAIGAFGKKPADARSSDVIPAKPL